VIKIAAVGGYPCKNVINKCLQSVITQTFTDWELAVVLDPGDYKIIVDDPRIRLYFNDTPRFAVANTLKGVSMLQPSNEDIIIFLDCDDWLMDNALEMVVGMYEKYPETLVTHGSLVPSPDNGGYKKINNPYTKDEFSNIRGARWKGSHLKSMKYKVFKMIKDEDFRDDNGAYFCSGVDLAVMFPALEMAGHDRVKFIKEKIYVYNISGVRSPHTHSQEILNDVACLKNKQTYEMI
jgi:glycosyltransferase involved in cell wall biosynthesis